MNLKVLTLTLLLSNIFLHANSQQKDSLYYLYGQVVQQDGESPVSFAHVININRRWGVVSDTLGFFNIWVMPDDTLNVSAIGYKYREYRVQGFIKDSLIKISLENRTYEIPEARISYLGTYKEFEYKVLNLKLPESDINPEFQKQFKHVEPPPPFMEPTVTSPASLIYVMFSKDAKDKKKYIKLEKESKITDKVRERYNEDIVKNITGLEGDKISEFMKFCNFKDEYILSIDDYKLYSEIRLKYEAYKKSNQDSLKNE